MVRRGVTLIEVIVSISIIAVLLSFAAPALMSTQAAAREQQCLATIRGVGQAAHVWMTEHKGFFPHLGEPGVRYNTYTIPETGQALDWFDNSWSWTISMRGYIEQRASICPWHPSHDEPSYNENSTGSNYTLVPALYTNWAMWKDPDPLATMDQLRPVQLADVASPANKSMFVEFIPFHLPGFELPSYNAVALAGQWGAMHHGVNTVLVDGSARSPKINTLASGPTAPLEFLLDPYEADDIHPFPLASTRDGFLGRDF